MNKIILFICPDALTRYGFESIVKGEMSGYIPATFPTADDAAVMDGDGEVALILLGHSTQEDDVAKLRRIFYQAKIVTVSEGHTDDFHFSSWKVDGNIDTSKNSVEFFVKDIKDFLR